MRGASRIKVAHVITRMDLGGAQHNTLYTATHLDPERFDCLLVTGPGGALRQELDALEREGGPRVVRIDSLVRAIHPFLDLLALLQLASLFLQERPEVVHTHSSKAGVLGRLAARLAGVPVIVHTYHGFGFHDYQSPRLRWTFVLAERLCARVSTALVFVSRANMATADSEGIGRGSRRLLIRSGVPLSRLPARVEDPAQKKASLGLRMHKPVVCSVGNLKPQKNPGDFVEMARLVSREVPEADFIFVGDGPLRNKIECRVVASGLHGRVALPGWRRDVPELLAVSEVFVLTSLWEGLPRALVEAMRSGLPPVCYATDGVEDVVQDGVNGYLVPPGSVQDLSDRVVLLLKDKTLRKRLGEAAAASIGPEFDIDAMVRRQEELYTELLP